MSHRDLYKKRTVLSQDERRRRTLEEQKKRRSQTFDLNRDFVVDEDDGTKEFAEKMEVCKSPHKRKRKSGIYKLIMFSEWLLDVPEDLTENWYFMPSPVGKRCVVIANKGYTKMFTKWGKLMRKFQSALPCGCKGEFKFQPTILDCIWSEKNSTCYVLDVIVWKGQSFNDCEADFRFYWLKNKFQELPELQFTSTKNHCHIQALPSCQYNPADLVSEVGINSVWANQTPGLDGILFYHQNGHYYSGQVTPLVGWLKPFMLPEALGVEVPDLYVDKCPENYSSMREYILEEIAKEKALKSKRNNMEYTNNSTQSMDHEENMDDGSAELEETESMTFVNSPSDSELGEETAHRDLTI